MEISKVQLYGIIIIVLAYLLRLIARFIRVKLWKKIGDDTFCAYLANAFSGLVEWLLTWFTKCAILFGAFLIIIEWFNKTIN